jgi:hypothetical protein
MGKAADSEVSALPLHRGVVPLDPCTSWASPVIKRKPRGCSRFGRGDHPTGVVVHESHSAIVSRIASTVVAAAASDRTADAAQAVCCAGNGAGGGLTAALRESIAVRVVGPTLVQAAGGGSRCR